MKILKTFPIIIGLSLLQACSWLMPYEDEFACNRPDNLGKCVSPTQAYEEMTSGQSSAPYMKPHSEKSSSDLEREENIDKDKLNSLNRPNVHSRYLDAKYSEIEGLLQDEITPVVKPVKTAELLVLPYSEKAHVLKGERVINVILEKPEFILGDYLNKKPIKLETLFN